MLAHGTIGTILQLDVGTISVTYNGQNYKKTDTPELAREKNMDLDTT